MEMSAIWRLCNGAVFTMGLGQAGRKTAVVTKIFICALLVCNWTWEVAQAQDSAAAQQQISLAAAAALLIQANRIEDAERVLVLALRQNPNDNEAIFLRGMIEVGRKNYDAAIEDFRRILASEPERERVRLELARVFFLQTDYENAERNFRFARAGDLPDEAKANVDQYLAAIIRLKRWSYDFSLGVADDTNV